MHKHRLLVLHSVQQAGHPTEYAAQRHISLMAQQQASTCPALRLSFFPPQALSADACSARPNEKLSTQGLHGRINTRSLSMLSAL